MPYTHIFFDLDHTLWDFERCSAETLEELFYLHQLWDVTGIRLERFIETYRIVNRRMWSLYSAGQISQQELRDNRFAALWKELSLTAAHLPITFADEYLRLCPQKPHLLPYAHEVLDYLKQTYQLHIVTNGFADVQLVKLRSAGITSYFSHVITSDRAGYRKPDGRIFDFAVELVQAQPTHCLMIGDDLEADIAGARNAGLDHVFFNYERVAHRATPTHEINCLSELKKLL